MTRATCVRMRNGLSLRPYQKRIVDDVIEENAIIKMPTGSGKTYVASAIIERHLNKVGNKKKGIFFVPTIDLVDQQAKAIETWIGTKDTVARYHGGGISAPSMDKYKVLVTTPVAFLSLQDKYPSEKFGWDLFCICVFDEVHHVLKDHPFRKVAFRLKKRLPTKKGENVKSSRISSYPGSRSSSSSSSSSISSGRIQILGLSASLTYAVTDERIKKALNRLCSDLCITKMCTPSSEELIAGGYKPPLGEAEIIDIQEKPDGVLPKAAQVPHRMHEIFCMRVRKREATRFTLLIWDTIQLLERHALQLEPLFSSPLNNLKLSSWADYAYKLKIKHKSHEVFFQMLEDWYVGLKLLVISWEEEEPLTMQWLKCSGSLKSIDNFSPELRQTIGQMEKQASNVLNFARLVCLEHQLLDKNDIYQSSFKCIIFVQQRLSAYIITNFINTNEKLIKAEMRAGFVAAKGSQITPSMRLTSSKSKETFDQFRDGRINILVATSVAEEGIDVPAANVVISYNHMKDSVELCQREGRARQQKRSFVILEQRLDRPINVLNHVTQEQEKIIQNFDPMMVDQSDEKDIQAQRSREVGAHHLLETSSTNHNFVSVLNMYRQKTKAQLKETMTRTKDGKHVIIQLQYESIRITVNGVGEGPNKKQAKKIAARVLLTKLKETINETRNV